MATLQRFVEDWRDSEKMARWKADVRAVKVSFETKECYSNRFFNSQATVDDKYHSHILHLHCYQAEYLQPRLLA